MFVWCVTSFARISEFYPRRPRRVGRVCPSCPTTSHRFPCGKATAWRIRAKHSTLSVSIYSRLEMIYHAFKRRRFSSIVAFIRRLENAGVHATRSNRCQMHTQASLFRWSGQAKPAGSHRWRYVRLIDSFDRDVWTTSSYLCTLINNASFIFTIHTSYHFWLHISLYALVFLFLFYYTKCPLLAIFEHFTRISQTSIEPTLSSHLFCMLIT